MEALSRNLPNAEGDHMKAIVTGVAGFIGSQLAEQLLAAGDTVVGIDDLNDYYDVQAKVANIESLSSSARFQFVKGDLCKLDLRPHLTTSDVVYHLAAQAGVRLSWNALDRYLNDNILATERIARQVYDACARIPIIYSSSSSVYGMAETYPCSEDDPTRPFSPYGVTKLAAEHLLRSYVENYSLNVTCLRYFTVYGPRQRPDMAMHRLINSALTGTTFRMFGDGAQIRDFTYVGDVIRANALAGRSDLVGFNVLNVAAGGQNSLRSVIALIEQICEREIRLERQSSQAGDVLRTGGSTARIEALLGWKPETELKAGLTAQVDFQRASLVAVASK